jgi:hypothetical protein
MSGRFLAEKLSTDLEPQNRVTENESEDVASAAAKRRRTDFPVS